MKAKGDQPAVVLSSAKAARDLGKSSFSAVICAIVHSKRESGLRRRPSVRREDRGG